MTIISNIEFVHQLTVAEISIENAHQVLDDLGVPRKSGMTTNYTLFGRLDWLREWCPTEFNALREAVREVKDGR